MEEMEVDLAVPSFSSAKLLGLKELVGHDDLTALANAEFSADFARCITTLCQELKTLCNLQEAVPQLGEGDDGNFTFLLELSSFLGELDCPHEEITCGSLEERLCTPAKRKLLVNFLFNEIKAARLFAKNALTQPVAEGGDKELTPFLTSALKAVNAPKPAGNVPPVEMISLLHKAADARLQSCAERPTPIFTAKLDARQWRKVDKLVSDTAQNCRSRCLVLLKRIDVTVNSFLWSDRLKSREKEIRDLFAKRREAMSHVTPPDLACLLAASHDLLRIEQTSSARLRKNTRSMPNPLALAPRPADRGGRTNEMVGDIAREQASAQRGRGRGGGGGGFRGQSAPQQTRHFNQQEMQRGQPYFAQQDMYAGISREQMTQQEYRGSAYDNPRDRGRGYGHRGGGRGRGGRGGGGRDYYGHDNRY
ncbi:unnamed protein product [Cylicocyclus nassatus]|uniref:Protein FAM98A n=1 Tax=Cylicocyclus nassatus TaxID=53992 RepID=A0AA36M890_CYLNA|nr:unnamed protein product [Cylicocyclus nassatus]